MKTENLFEKSDFFDMSESDRVKALNTNCESVKEGYTYSKPLSKIQIDKKNTEINQALSEVDRLKEERKELNGSIKLQNEIIAINNHDVIRGYREVCERVWEVNNYQTGFTEKVNIEGLIIEKQRFQEGTKMSLFNKKRNENEKTGT